MNPPSFSGHEDPQALLASLLEASGIPYRRDGDRFRFLLATRGCRWETVCRCRKEEILVYGRYPFRPQAHGRVLEACGEVNAQVLQGGMFLWEGEVLFRTCALCAQPLEASENLSRALEYNAAVMAEFWTLLQRASTETDS